MELEKRHYWQIVICILLSVISCAIYAWYYREYIKPHSYTIGQATVLPYEKLAIKDYISKDDVLFSQNINDITFTVENGIATYEYRFDAKQYNGLLTDYALFVNEDLVNDTQNAGTFNAVHKINYINVDNEVFNTTDINIAFTFQNLASTLRVTFEDKNDNLGLLMNYFKHNSFVITLCENPFTMDKVQTDDEFGRIECGITVADDARVYVEYNGALSTITAKPLMVARTGSLKVFTVVSNKINNIKVVTDGTYTVDYNAENYEYTITWQDANTLSILLNAEEA